jgi:protein SCO1/2
MSRFAACIGAALLTVLFAETASAAAASGPPPVWDRKTALAYSQAAIGHTLHDGRFATSDGRTVRLADFRGKPLIVNFVYTSCSQICPLVIESLDRSVGVAKDALGKDSFAVITVGFDTRHDTPAQMRAYAKSHGAGGSGWLFLSGDGKTVARLAEDTGFAIYPSAQGFDHMAQTTIVDADGRIYRHVYGGAFEPPAIVEPLKDLIFGRRGNLASVGGIINRIRLFCTVYSPGAERYRFDYGIFIAFLIGLVSLGAIGFVLVRAALRPMGGRAGAGAGDRAGGRRAT